MAKVVMMVKVVIVLNDQGQGQMVKVVKIRCLDG